MHARSTTFRGRPGALDTGIAHVRDDVLPAVLQIEGCVGLSMLVDRHTGLCVVTTSWDDEEAMHASAEAIGGIRDRLSRTLEGAVDEAEIAEWEVGVLHRMLGTPEHAAARVIYTRGPLGAADRIVERFRSHIVPRVHELSGFCSISLFVNRENGRSAITTVYEDRQTMNRAKGQAQAMREEFTTHLGMQITEVIEFDVALAHLRVPETV
ncbi:antibiotic biosynthesis monooxygenase [Blastococcus sp. SYSU D00922]